MAKIRVHELARMLNMTNKALLDKLGEMNISVKSHMSSLDDETVARVKENLLGKEDSGAVDDKRRKQTVIRRRKRPNTERPPEKRRDNRAHTGQNDGEPVEEGVKSSFDKERSTVPSLDKEGSHLHHSDKEASLSDSDKERTPLPSSDKEERPLPHFDKTPESRATSEKTGTDEHTKKGGKRVRRKRPRKRDKDKDMPARIIRLPEVKPVQETKSTQETKPTVHENRKKNVFEKQKFSENLKGKSDKSRPEKYRTDKYRTDKPKTESHRTERPGTERNRTERPRTERPKPDRFRVDKPKIEGTIPIEDDRKGDKEKKKKKTIEEPAREKKVERIRWTKKKISFKRKEVVEGDALYDSDQRTRKVRKTSKAKPLGHFGQQKPTITTPKAIKRRIKIDNTIVLSDLAKRMGVKASDIITKLIGFGIMAAVNNTIEFDTAALVAAEFGYEIERASFEENEYIKTGTDNDPANLTPRPPVVTVMGHVDHGKTSLLDVIRKTRVTESEAGGITQHIGAYNVSTEKGQIVFLDTPGHEAFTAMRARGATITDIVILVVAADDGVMPQTTEAINHAKAAGVPIIVAVNKIDKPNADPERVFRQLSEYGLVPEAWGGDTIFVKVSAKQNIGINELLEMILLQAEVLELRANPDTPAYGYVVEAKLDAGRGPVATVLIQNGTLRAGDFVICGVHHGKIRAMLNDLGVQVESAGPSMPVEILGISGVPNAGNEMVVLADEKSAKQVSTHRIQKQRSIDLAKPSRPTLENLFAKMQEGTTKELNIVLKADVNGSIEALSDSLAKLSNEEVAIRIIHAAAGAINESDISLAAVSNAIIIGFNVRPVPKVQAMAHEEGVDMRFYSIIYDVIKDVKDAIVGMMASTFEERVLGRAEVRQVFHVPKIGFVAGSYITDGKIQRGGLARLLRDSVVVYEGKIGSLRRFKDDVKEVVSGYECGIGIENYNDIKVGDIIECYYMEEIKPEL